MTVHAITHVYCACGHRRSIVETTHDDNTPVDWHPLGYRNIYDRPTPDGYGSRYRTVAPYCWPAGDVANNCARAA